ncbi:MAG TPA: hypothetical protein VFZ59_01670 [Verrucomicrobiae bacterium]|nr:hypothetical protein [Verrucomicrobiae bacterium]
MKLTFSAPGIAKLVRIRAGAAVYPRLVAEVELGKRHETIVFGAVVKARESLLQVLAGGKHIDAAQESLSRAEFRKSATAGASVHDAQRCLTARRWLPKESSK